MTDTTRRGFLAAAGLGTAAGAVAVAATSMSMGGHTAESAAAKPAEQAVLPSGARGAMAAYVHDVRAGEVALMVDGHQYVIKDSSLVAGLAQAYARASA